MSALGVSLQSVTVMLHTVSGFHVVAVWWTKKKKTTTEKTKHVGLI